MAFLRVSSFALVCLIIGIIIPAALADYQPFSARAPPVFHPQPPQIACSYHQASSYRQPQRNPPVDYTLAIQWGRTYCNSPLYCGTRQEFTVHGLWITNKPPRCTGQCFDVTLLGSMLDTNSFRRRENLDRFWINARYNPQMILRQKNEWFRNYEYLNHGICVNTDVLSFFQIAVEAYRSVHPRGLSRAVKTLFGPNRNNRVRVNEGIIRPRLRAILPYELAMVCTSGTYELLELRIKLRFTVNGWQIVNNPNLGNCTGRNIMLP